MSEIKLPQTMVRVIRSFRITRGVTAPRLTEEHLELSQGERGDQKVKGGLE